MKQKLGAHEYPREVDFIDEFPQTVTGKIKRRDLRDQRRLFLPVGDNYFCRSPGPS